METGKCDIYKRNHKIRKLLKLNCSKATLNKFNKKMFPISFENCETNIKLGIKECLEKELITEYPVVKCHNNEYVCRVMFTVVVKNEPIVISGKSADNEFNKFI